MPLKLCALALALAAQDPFYRTFRGETPPEFAIPIDRWLNADRAVTLESLRGKAVWVELIGSIF